MVGFIYLWCSISIGCSCVWIETRPKDYVEPSKTESSDSSDEGTEDSSAATDTAPNEEAPKWQILHSPEGYPYFWNTETNGRWNMSRAKCGVCELGLHPDFIVLVLCRYTCKSGKLFFN